jgi:hypothetical protein
MATARLEWKMSSKHSEVMKAGGTHPLTPDQFKASPEFKRFRGIMRKLLKVPKSELVERVRVAKETSPRAGNPKAAGRKKKTE